MTGQTFALWQCAKGCEDFNFLPTTGFSMQPLKVKLLAGEQKATEIGFPKQPKQRTLENCPPPLETAVSEQF